MGVRTIFAETCSRAKRWPVVGARFIAPNRRQVSVLCGWGVPHPRATARVPSPHPHRTRPYKDTEQLILLRSLCKGGCDVVRSGDPCGPYTGRFFRGKSEQVENTNKTCYAP